MERGWNLAATQIKVVWIGRGCIGVGGRVTGIGDRIEGGGVHTNG